MDTLKDFEKVIKRKCHIQAPMTYHSTLCSVPDCYGNCHEHCGLNFSLDPSQLSRCIAMHNRGSTCKVCGHRRDDHRHYNTLWKEVEEDERVVDEEAEKKYREATSEKDRKEAMKERAQIAIDELTKNVDDAIIQLGILAEEYANLSLSGSFAGQVEKSLKLLELNIEKMRNDGSDPEVIKKVEKSMASMDDKLKVLREAKQKTQEKSNFAKFKSVLAAAFAST